MACMGSAPWREKNPMLNIVKYYKFWFWVSAILLVAGIVSLVVFRLKPGIDFTGGALTQIQFSQDVPQSSDIQKVLADTGFPEAQIQSVNNTEVLIRRLGH